MSIFRSSVAVWRVQMSALPQPVSPCSSARKEFAGKYRLYARRFEIYVPPNGRGFSAEKCYLPPLLSEFLMLGFYEAGSGAFSCCLRRTPISVLIHYLWRIGTHRPTNTHSPHFYFFFFFAPAHKYLRVADILTAVSPRDLGVSATPALTSDLF